MSERVYLAPEDVEAVARRVVELLHDEGHARPPAGLVTAHGLATLLGVSRGFIYDNADALGGQRLGDGPRARLRFDVDTARAALTTAPRAELEPERTTPRRRTTRCAAQLLPVHGLPPNSPKPKEATNG